MQDELLVGIRAELEAVVSHKQVDPRVLGVLVGGREGGSGGREGGREGSV